MNDKEIKKSYNSYYKHYRLYRSERNKNNWTRFTVSESDMKVIVKNNMTLGFDFKLYPYKFRFFYIFKWFTLSLIAKLKKFDKKLSKFFGGGYWKLLGGILLIIYALMKFKIIIID